MKKSTSINGGLICWAAIGLVAVLSADAAELRTTAAGQRIQRTAGFEISDAGSEEIFIEPFAEPFIGTTCAECGVSGCNAGCVQSCGRWARFDYLLWWRKGNSVPALATTSPAGTLINQAGVLGAAGTSVLFGNETYGEDASPGGRFTIGGWLDDCQCNSWEARFFGLGEEIISFNMASNGDPILVRPFNNQDALIGPVGPLGRPIAFQGIASNGSITIRGESEIYGGDVIFRHRFRDLGGTRFNLLGGYQYSRIDENLTISDSFVDANPANLVVDGTRQDIVDRFATENEFNGAVFGIEATIVRDCWRLEMLARLGFGNMRQQVSIAGQTTNTVAPNNVAVLAEGLLANAGNQGVRERDEFAVVPELGATFVYELSDCIDLSVGYSFIYWSNVVQPGDQIDANLFVPSQFAFNDGSYWVHGFNTGVEFRF